MRALASRLWARAGGAGLCTYGPVDTLHYYLGADLAVWAMLAHKRDSADSVFSSMLRWRTPSGGAPELFSRASRSYGQNLPPHATSAAALVSYVRNALVCDNDDTLRVTLGARAAWWSAGSHIRKAPTRWGAIDLDFKRTEDAVSWEWSPVQTWTALTLPPGTRIAGPLPRHCRSREHGTVVFAPPLTRSLRIIASDMD